jgi:hypothetical protein
MNVARHEIAERAEHHALALDPAFALERRRDDRELKMGLALRARAGVAGVAGGVVLELETGGRERGGEAPADGIGDGHGEIPDRLVACGWQQGRLVSIDWRFVAVAMPMRNFVDFC